MKWGQLDRPKCDEFQVHCQGLKTKPAWYSYLKPCKAKVWNSFSVEEQGRAAAALKRYFEVVASTASVDLNMLLFLAYEQQGCNFVADLLPDYKRRLKADSWNQVIRALASLVQDIEDPDYNRKKSGGVRRSFFRAIRKRPCGAELVASLWKWPPRGRNGWQLLWLLMRACASLKDHKYDFGKALDDAGVIDFLKKDYGLGGDAALKSWKDRQEKFSDFIARLPGVSWNTFDYVLRDMKYPGCRSLFKVDCKRRRENPSVGAAG